MSVRQPVLLVIDDDPEIVTLIERLAGSLSFTVVAHANAQVALERLAEIAPDAALVDLRLPNVNGLDVLQRIRTAVPTCSVSVMTAEASIDSAIEAVTLGALDCLAKPLDPRRLSALLVTVRKNGERRETLLRADADWLGSSSSAA